MAAYVWPSYTGHNKIEITGQWHDEQGFQPDIRVREPWNCSKKPNEFTQTIRLQPGEYVLELEYEPFLDKRGNTTLGENLQDFDGLKINGKVNLISFRKYSEEVMRAHCKFHIEEGIEETVFQLSLFNTRPIRTWITSSQGWKSSRTFVAVRPELRDSAVMGEHLLIHGIPFNVRKTDLTFLGAGVVPVSQLDDIDRGGLMPWKGKMHLPCGKIGVRKAYFLGMIHSIDYANGSWYSKKGDHSYSHFAGDKAGEIRIQWSDGTSDTVPLIFGFNLWYSKPWDMLWHYSPYTGENHGQNHDSALYCGEHQYMEVFREGISLADGMRVMGSNSCNTRFIFTLNLEGRSVDSFEIVGTDELKGHPVISAITLECSESARISLPDEVGPLPEIPCGENHLKAISLEYIRKHAYEKPLDKTMRLLYTFQDELPLLENPERPGGYFGPEYDFRGRQEALYAATYLYYNGPECGAYIADIGTECCSSTAKWSNAHYMFGIGVCIERKPLFNGLMEWFELYTKKQPGELPGKGNAWTRGIGELLREATAFGYDKFTETYLDWLDHILFTEANPPHWNRVAGYPFQDGVYQEIQVGDVLERGNRENDGHGICMWGRYMVWHWKGRAEAWNQRRWEATKASVEWIQWQLDNDIHYPGVRKDLLFTESECAHKDYDIYSSYNCMHGIRLAIRMAEQLGKTEEVERWKKLFNRIGKGILQHLVDDSEFGPIWHTYEHCDWQDHAHKLVHLQLATEGDTFTPLDDYAQGSELDRIFLEIDLNTYKYLMRDKNYNCLRMYGYGQGMMTQSALLMDQMRDAERFIEKLVRFAYLPKFGRWLAPEGIIVHKSGKYSVPVNCYMGQDSHVADSTKALRLMLGVDDNHPEQLKLVPRFPVEWEKASINDFPVLLPGGRRKVSYRYERTEEFQQFEYRFDDILQKLDVRLGPLPTGKSILSILLDGVEKEFQEMFSGDSRWVWIRNLTGSSGVIRVMLG